MHCLKHLLFSTIIYFCLNTISKLNGDIRIWKHSTLYNNPQNWVNGKIPCDTAPVVFPTDLETEISFFPAENKMSQLILPRTGILNIPSVHSVIEFYDKETTRKCDGQDRLFKPLKKERWLDPNNWISSTYKNNTAIPDLERVPCQHDSVKFSSSTEISIEFPNVPVELSGLIFDKQAIDMADYPIVNIENIIFNEGDECSLKSGCLCHPERWENDDRLEKQICDNERKHCKQLYCLTPIRPVGQCCDICGSMLLMKYTSEFSLKTFKNYCENFLKENNFHNIDFYVSKVWNDEIQLIFRERDEYSMKCNDAANQIKELIQKDTHLGLLFFSIRVSGQYNNPNGVGGFKIVFLALLGALVIIGGAYVVTQNSHQYPIVPQSLRNNLRLNSLPSLGSYAPFRNTGFNLESCWPFSSYTELDSTQNENIEFLPTSPANHNDNGDSRRNEDQEFENPLYNQEERIDGSGDTEVESYDLENDVQGNPNVSNVDPLEIIEIEAENQEESLIQNTDLLDTNDTKDHLSNELSITSSGQEISQDSLVDVSIGDKEL